MEIAPFVYRKCMVAYGHRPNHDEIPQYYVQQLIWEFILHLDVDYTYYRYEFYGVGKGHIVNCQQA